MTDAHKHRRPPALLPISGARAVLCCVFFFLPCEGVHDDGGGGGGVQIALTAEDCA